MQHRWCSVLVAAALAGAAHGAHAQESMPDMLRRVAPAVVQIKAGKEPVGSGFVYPTPRHVVTAYTAVNQDGELSVVLADGKVARAKVVAWSEADDLAILELSLAANAAPLPLETTSGFAGEQVVLLGHPTLADSSDEDPSTQRAIATPRFGFVGLVSATQVNVDVHSSPGDAGAPIISPAGRVLGVLSGKTERRRGLVDAASVARIQAAQAQIGRQGLFKPKPPANKGLFGGVYVAPWQAYHQVGAGLLSGFHYRWWAVTLTSTFSHASFTPLDADTMRARWSVAAEGYFAADWRYMRQRRLSFGTGLAFTWTMFDMRRNGRRVELDSKDRFDARIDPLFVIQDIEGPWLVGVSYAPFAQAGRLDIGVVFGRQ